MQIAELIGIDETELRGFLLSIPNLWNARTKFFEHGIDLVLSNFVDCEHILTSTHIFNISKGCLVFITEYLKDVGAATFKIYAYTMLFASLSTDEPVERRFMNMIMEYSDKDMASFREFAYLGIFVCPICHAQYSFRVLLIRDDGLVQCQNCNKFVHVTEPRLESEVLLEDSEEDDTESLS